MSESSNQDSSVLEGKLHDSFTRLQHRSLVARIAYIEAVEVQLKQQQQQQLAQEKPGPFKKLLRAVINGLLDGYYTEQRWINALFGLFIQLHNAKDHLPIPLYETAESIIKDITSVPNKYQDVESALSLLRLCCFLLQLDSNCTLVSDGYTGSLLSIAGECVDSIATVAHHRPSHRSTTAAATVVAAATATPAALQTAYQYIRALLNQRGATCVSFCMELWTRSLTFHPAACTLLLQFCATPQWSELHAETKFRVVEYFKKRLLTATKQQYTELSSGKWIEFIKLLNSSDWETTAAATSSTDLSAAATPSTDLSAAAADDFETLLTKAMKKAPESSAPFVAAFVCNMNTSYMNAINVAATTTTAVAAVVDFSKFITDTAAVSTLKLLKSSDKSVRSCGMLILHSLTRRCAAAAAYSLLVQTLLDGFTGKGATGVGGLTTAQSAQKLCVLSALCCCGSAAAAAIGAAATARVAVAAAVVTALQAAMAREQDTSIRLVIATAVGVWLEANCEHVEMAGEVSEFLAAAKQQLEKSQISTHGSLMQCTLLALNVALIRNEELLSTAATTTTTAAAAAAAARFTDLTAACIAIVKESSKRTSTAAHIDALLALQLLLRLLQQTSAAATSFDAAKLWTTALASDSIFFSSDLAKFLSQRKTTTTTTTTEAATTATEWYLVLPIDAAIAISGGNLPVDFVGTAVLFDAAALAMISNVRLISRIFPQQLQQIMATAAAATAVNSNSCSSSGYNNSSSSNSTSNSNSSGGLLFAIFIVSTAAKNSEVRNFAQRCITEMCVFSELASQQLLTAVWLHLEAGSISIQQQQKKKKKLQSCFTDGETSSVAAAVAVNRVSAHYFAAICCLIQQPMNTATTTAAATSAAVAVVDTAAVSADSSLFIAELLLLLAHPRVSSSRKRALQHWKQAMKLLQRQQQQQQQPQQQQQQQQQRTSAVADAIISASKSDCEDIRVAAQTALFILHSTAATTATAVNSIPTTAATAATADVVLVDVNAINSAVVSSLLHTLQVNTDSITALDEDCLFLYHNKHAAIQRTLLQQQEATASAATAATVITNADRKKSGPRSARRGNFGSDGVEDEDWALRVKREKEEKLQQLLLSTTAAAAAGGDALEVKVTAEVEEKWQRIDDVVQQVLNALQLLRFHCELDRVQAQKCVEQLLLADNLLLLLLSSPLLSVAAAAVDTLRHVVLLTIDRDMLPLASDFCAALLAVSHAQQTSSEVSPSFESLLRLLQGVLAVVSRNAWSRTVTTTAAATTTANTTVPARYLEPCSFLLLFPIIKFVLSLPHVLPGTEHAFLLLDRLWPVGSIFITAEDDVCYLPRIESLRPLQKHVLQLCLLVLSRPNNRIEPSPQRVFLRIATQLLPLSEDEWLPLLQDAGALNAEQKVRLTVVQAVIAMQQQHQQQQSSIFELQHCSAFVQSSLWLLKQDEDEAVRELAAVLWGSERVPDSYFQQLLPLLFHSSQRVCNSAAKSIAAALKLRAETVLTTTAAAVEEANTVLEGLKQLLQSNLPIRSSVKPLAVKTTFSKPAKLSKSSNKASATTTAAEAADEFYSRRLSVARTLRSFGELVALPTADAAVVISVLSYIVERGVVDVNAAVRSEMLAAGRAVIDGYGNSSSTMITAMQQLLKTVIAQDAPTTAAAAGEESISLEEAITIFDHRRSAAVVLLGATGKHLNKDDPAVVEIAQSLINALRTPSDAVQRAVADCLSPLVQSLKGSEAAAVMLNELVDCCLHGDTYGDRRGAAFGVSSFVKGLGISCLKQLDIITRMRDACTNGSVNERQGALFVFETLSERLGLLFEPYIISIIEVLLKSFSHSSDHVREAAQQAARVIMNKLSAHGVKQILSPILASLPNETAWKSRQEGIHLLGMMAHCAPKQLASSLPQVVPALVQAGNDPHPKVKESARVAMQDISSVIKNPEVSRLSPVLLAAIADPANKTKVALETLLETEFMHSIDAASLALLVPILSRSLRDRGADLKRKSAAITGNMVTMVSDTKMLSPYLSQVMPGLQECLLDPIPDVRATAAKALGSLFVGMGDDNCDLQLLLPWLLKTLCSEISPVERSGAGQGLAEICGTAFTSDRIHDTMKSALLLQQQNSTAREGLLWFLSFLPTTLNERFSEHIDTTLPVVLTGLSDESDGVREVALRAGQVIVFKMGMSHTVALLPALTAGLFEEDWRIRQNSLRLLGELLCLVGDAVSSSNNNSSSSNDEEEEENGSTAAVAKVGQRIRQHVGEEHSSNVLSSIYIARSDVSPQVRQSALLIWKSIVSNSPRTLLQIMPALVKQLIEKLAAASEVMRAIAGSSLGDIVSKLGDKVLPAVVGPLRHGLLSAVVSEREGVCSGLADILNACNKAQAEQYLDVLIPALQQALCDEEIAVRQKAARAFLRLYKTVGNAAMDEIVPALLRSYGDGAIAAAQSSQLALCGLQEIVQLRPRDLLDYLLPKLLTSPVQREAATALGAVLAVAGQQLEHYFSSLFPTIVSEFINMETQLDKLKKKLAVEEAKLVAANAAATAGDAEGRATAAAAAAVVEDLSMCIEDEVERFTALQTAAASMMSAVTTAPAVHQLVSELGKLIEHDSSVVKRRWGCWMAQQAFNNAQTAAMEEYFAVLLKYLLSRIAETDTLLLQALVDAMNALVAAVPVANLSPHAEFMRNCINSNSSAARHRTGGGLLVDVSTGELQLPYLSLPKSLDALFTIYLHALMNGSSSAREAAAEAIGELAQMAQLAVLKPLLVKTTGPLIRAVGDRNPSSLKAAILQTVMILMRKGGAALKAFAPQLQTTFVKSLQDPSRDVRRAGAVALGRLVLLTSRLDPLLVELSAVAASTDSTAIKSSALEALGNVLTAAGEKATAAVAEEKVAPVLVKAVSDEDDAVRAMASRALSRLSWFLSPAAQVDNLLEVLHRGKAATTTSSSSSQQQQQQQHWSLVCGRLQGAGALLQAAGQNAADEREEAFRAIQAAVADERVAVSVAAISAIAMMLTIPCQPVAPEAATAANAIATGTTTGSTTAVNVAAGSLAARAEERKVDLRAAAQGVIRIFSPLLGAVLERSTSADAKAFAVLAIKEAARNYYGAVSQQLKHLIPPLVAAITGIDLRLKYESERALKLLYEGLTAQEVAAGLAPGQGAAVSQFLAAAENRDTAQFVRDYAKRVLSRITVEVEDY